MKIIMSNSFEQPKEIHYTRCFNCGHVHYHDTPEQVPGICESCGIVFGGSVRENPEQQRQEQNNFNNKSQFQDKQQKEVKEENFDSLKEFYTIIGIRRHQLDNDPDPLGSIKKKYDEFAKKYHPDKKGGNEEWMKQLNIARDKLKKHYSK